ncbi:MAG: O-antigen ligase family protein [Acidobacteriota bacterium]|nr:O-antigen ligase family protein [Acidobacteriota bacterium]
MMPGVGTLVEAKWNECASAWHAQSLRERWSLGDLFILLVPAAQFIQVQAVGTLFGTDLLLLAVLPFLLARGAPRLARRQVLLLLLLAAFWLAGQVVTDLYRETTAADYLRGWSKIALTITHLAAIYILLRDSLRRFFLYGIGLCAGQLLTIVYSPNDYFAGGSHWKFGYGLPVTLGLTLLSAWWLRKRRGSALMLGLSLVLSVVNLTQDFRSLGLISAGAGLYTFFITRPTRSRSRKLRMVLAGITIVAAALAFESVYIYAASNGLLGASAQHRLELSEGSGGMLLGGRGEILASAQAILDSPLLGHGSWAKDPKYFALMLERRRELNYKNDRYTTEAIIPSHSYIFGAWVESGVTGAIFWMWVFGLTVHTLWKSQGNEPLFPFFALILTLLLWNILFSPYGADQRFVATYYIAAMLMFRSYTLYPGSGENGTLTR